MSPVRLLLPLLLSLLAPPLMALRPGPAFPISSPALEPAPSRTDVPRIASSGQGFLAVWDDSGGVRAARFSADGSLLDETGFGAGSFPVGLAVASDGEDYLIAYGCAARQVCLVHVEAASGRVTSGSTIPSAVQPAVASNGRTYVVAYVTQESYGSQNNFLETVEVSRKGIVETTPVRMSRAFYPPAIASNGRDYFVAWSDYLDLQTALLGPSGTPLRRETIRMGATAGPGVFSWDVASDGRDFLLVWQQNVGVQGGSYSSAGNASRVAPDGTRAPARRIESLLATAFDPALAWNGSEYVLVFSAAPRAASSLLSRSDGDVYQIALTRDGDAAGEVEIVSERPGLESSADVASSSLVTVIVWKQSRRWESVSSIVARAGAGEPIVLSRRPAWQQSVTAARVGPNFVVAWEEIVEDGTKRKVFLQRVDPSGAALDGRGVALADSGSAQAAPVIGGTVLAWIEQPHVWSRDAEATVFAKMLREEDGRPVPGPTMSLGSAMFDARVSIARAGDQHLVVWSSPEGNIVGRRISTAGTLIDQGPFAISGAAEVEWGPAVASDGEAFLVAWNRTEPAWYGCVMVCPPPASLHAAIVTAMGVPWVPVEVAPVHTGASFPHVVWNGAGYGVFWMSTERESWGRPPTAKSRPMGRFGLPAGPPVTIGEPYHQLGGAAWNGREYVVALSEWRSGTYFLTLRRYSPALAPTGATLLETAHVFSRIPHVSVPLGETNVALVFTPAEGLAAYPRNEQGVSRLTGKILEDEVGPRRRSAGR